ncbi:MAG: hypothetical protein IKP25_05305 [Ruminococcus sp.]|nr:hypothetical protein [Ruminococcus sp.]
MAERKCLMTFYPTDCKDDCFNCKCGGAEATKDMYVSINNVQRVCAIMGGAADTDEGEYIAEVIRNNLENMAIPATDVQAVVRCKDCKHRKERHYEESGEKPYIKYECEFTKYSMSDDGFCSFGARMDGGADNENS